jgi:hypothetical protein
MLIFHSKGAFILHEFQFSDRLRYLSKLTNCISFFEQFQNFIEDDDLKDIQNAILLLKFLEHEMLEPDITFESDNQ